MNYKKHDSDQEMNLSDYKVRKVHSARKMTFRNLSLAGLFIALSLLGANVKFFGDTIALDSAPGFLATLMLGPGYGGLVGATGHIFSALISGMPLSPIVHGVTAFSMAIVMIIHGVLARKFGHSRLMIVTRIVIAILMNSIVATFPLISILGFSVIISLWLPLAIATTINVLIAEFIYYFWNKNKNSN